MYLLTLQRQVKKTSTFGRFGHEMKIEHLKKLQGLHFFSSVPAASLSWDLLDLGRA